MKPTNFNQLKNYLQVGMSLKLIDTSMKNHKYFNTARKIILKQTNAIKFEGGSWLGLGSTGEKASDFQFKDNSFILRVDQNTPYEHFLEYQYIV